MAKEKTAGFIEAIQRDFSTRPFFLYDLDAMKAHLAQVRVPGVKFWYATKANPLSSILKTAHESGFGIDCASVGEFKQALRSGVSPSEILITGPGKSPALLKEALVAGIRIFVLESIRQAQDLDQVAGNLGIRVTALLRMQLSFSGTEKSVLGGTKVTPFGLDEEAWKALDPSRLKNVDIQGVHCFQWGNILDAQRLEAIWLETLNAAVRLSAALKFKLSVLDLGGGLGIPYHGEKPLEFAIVAERLTSLKKKIPETEIWMELGRYAVGAFGQYVCSVIDQKKVLGKNFLVVEGGVHHLVRPALIQEAFPAHLLRSSVRSSSAQDLIEFDVHGPLCTSLDHLGKYSLPSDITVGDSLVFNQCGAYGFTESMPFFLCHDLPAEFVVKDQKIQCIRNWQSPEWWLV